MWLLPTLFCLQHTHTHPYPSYLSPPMFAHNLSTAATDPPMSTLGVIAHLMRAYVRVWGVFFSRAVDVHRGTAVGRRG
jgi:hypothetical protein